MLGNCFVVAPLDAMVPVFEIGLADGFRMRQVGVQYAQCRAPAFGVHEDDVFFFVINYVHHCEYPCVEIKKSLSASILRSFVCGNIRELIVR